MNFVLLPNWMLDEVRGKCEGMMNVKHFDTLAVDGSNLVVHDRNRFQRDTALAAWKRCWADLGR